MIIEQFPSTYQGIAQTGGPSSLTLDQFASTSPDAYKGLELYIASGAGAGQQRNVVGSIENFAPYSNYNSSTWADPAASGITFTPNVPDAFGGNSAVRCDLTTATGSAKKIGRASCRERVSDYV